MENQQARVVDAANPTDVRDETGAPVSSKKVRVTGQFFIERPEDVKALAEVHDMLGNSARANELRGLIGEEPKGKIGRFFTTKNAFSLVDIMVICGSVVAIDYGWRKISNYRKQKKLASVTQLHETTPPAPFQVAK